MSSIVPESLNAASVPPCPFAKSASLPGASRIALPSWSNPGSCPCTKNLTFSLSRPKKPFSSKKSTVAWLFAGLVMIYQGMVQEYFSMFRRIPSAKYWKSGLFRICEKRNVPFGPSYPSRVPWPPATVNPATLPPRSSSSPSAIAPFWRSAWDSFSGFSGTYGAGTSFSKGICSASPFFMMASSHPRTSVQLMDFIWSPRRSLSASEISFQNRRRCSCPTGASSARSCSLVCLDISVVWGLRESLPASASI